MLEYNRGDAENAEKNVKFSISLRPLHFRRLRGYILTL